MRAWIEELRDSIRSQLPLSRELIGDGPEDDPPDGTEGWRRLAADLGVDVSDDAP
jgi:hypothetical protein